MYRAHLSLIELGVAVSSASGRRRTWQLGEFSAPVAVTVEQEYHWVDYWTLQALSC
jgi:hypothetical protein